MDVAARDIKNVEIEIIEKATNLRAKALEQSNRDWEYVSLRAGSTSFGSPCLGLPRVFSRFAGCVRSVSVLAYIHSFLPRCLFVCLRSRFAQVSASIQDAG